MYKSQKLANKIREYEALNGHAPKAIVLASHFFKNKLFEETQNNLMNISGNQMHFFNGIPVYYKKIYVSGRCPEFLLLGEL